MESAGMHVDDGEQDAKSVVAERALNFKITRQCKEQKSKAIRTNEILKWINGREIQKCDARDNAILLASMVREILTTKSG